MGTVDLAAVFNELVEARRWVAWREETRRGKRTKVPYSPITGHPTDATKPDPTQHVSMEEASAHAEQADMSGVGIVLGDGLGGVDLDGCRDRETGEIAPWARKIIERFNTYTEISPSGTGFKLLAYGAPLELPANEISIDAPSMNGKRPAIECYASGRYFTVTGQILEGVPDEIQDRGELGGPWDQMVRDLGEQSRANGSGPDRKTGSATGATKIPSRLMKVLEGSGKAGTLWREGKGHGTDRSVNDAALAGTLGAMGFDSDEIEAAIRAYPLGQIGQGALAGKLADRQVGRLLGIATNSLGQAEEEASRSEGEACPQIRVRERLTEVTDEAMEAVAGRPDLAVYVRGRMLVTVARDGSPRVRWLQRPPGSPVIVPIEEARMQGILDLAADWVKYAKREKEWIPARPPAWVANQILAQTEWTFPYLEAVIEAPTLRSDGSVLSAPGWDEETGLLYEPAPGVSWPVIPDRPDHDDAKKAVEVLLDPVQDFPFVADTDKAAYLALILSLIGRHLIDGPVPGFPIRAPTPGTGKTLLAEVIGIIATGREPSAMSMTYQTEEFRKRIHSLALDGTPLVLLENVSGSLGSDVLAAALTAREWKDRVLGKTQMAEAPLRAVWLMTGNNLGFQRTLGRRVVPIDLDAKVETPEDRSVFEYKDLRGHVRKERPSLVVAALTILRAFHLDGRPPHGSVRMGSFEAWDDLIRSAVIWAGQEDPASTEENLGRGRIRALGDDDIENLSELLATLAGLYPNRVPFATADVITKAKQDHELMVMLDVTAAPPKGGHATAKSLGNTLREHKNRPIEGLVLRRVKRTWMIKPTDPE